MTKIKLAQYIAKRKVRKIINDKEQLVGERFIIRYNSAIPPKHRMLR